MKPPYFIETLALNGEVLHRHRVLELPIRLGRGYENDFILDDPYAAARHAIIEAGPDGGMVLRDLDTMNGVICRGRRHATLDMNGDTVFRLGHTSLRVRAADYHVEPELLDRTRHGWEGLVPGLIGIVLVWLIALANQWLIDTQPFQLVRYLQVLAYATGGALVWGGAWALANRLFGRYARLGRHLFILGSALAVLAAFKAGSSVLAFGYSLDALTRYSSHVLILIAAGMMYYHLNTVKPHNERRFGATCLVLALFISGLVMISNEQRTGSVADSHYMSVILPPDMRISPNHSVDEFMGDVEKLKPRLDRERADLVADDSKGEQ
ncbi:FHA domain-containing protein [Massilia sp. PAMC28688]|uniref:FHA domain-containing protein n=1 Tax=Massilia sp. PAMC28688 TaxID=2861283 RepID=UPI001C62B5A9|nr:FHA domain-containing protein [Massilia sp. PAMC28688]QYF92419.1 FHA domain-containing protein [Massilia sp. PAMC28688]